ncbi:MAG: hypothetical protein JWL59_3180 [Chthoniobacteraceae bacterium]|nr:hypothetical protein [Chthoniobacteraceae bacterium]
MNLVRCSGIFPCRLATTTSSRTNRVSIGKRSMLRFRPYSASCKRLGVVSRETDLLFFAIPIRLDFRQIKSVLLTAARFHHAPFEKGVQIS